MAVGIAARQTEAVESRAAQKNSTQCSPSTIPVSAKRIPCPTLIRAPPASQAMKAKLSTAMPVRQMVTSTGGEVSSFPRIAVKPHAITTRCMRR